MAKWNWGGEENQGVGRIPDGSGSHPSGHAGCAVDGASRVDPLRWQPIKTAPKDGTSVLLGWRGEPYLFVSRWVRFQSGPEGWHWVNNSLHYNPTHWLPLPPPPHRDSRLKREAPRRETGSAPQGAKAAVPSGNRPENPAYFWLGIQAEGRE